MPKSTQTGKAAAKSAAKETPPPKTGKKGPENKSAGKKDTGTATKTKTPKKTPSLMELIEKGEAIKTIGKIKSGKCDKSGLSYIIEPGRLRGQELKALNDVITDEETVNIIIVPTQGKLFR